jgi:cysteine-rich repeat protein
LNPELQTLKRKNSLRAARVVTTAIAIFLGSFLITGTARADLPKDPIPDVGGFLAPDDDVMKAELKAMAAWGKLQKDLKTCLDKGAKNQSKGKESRLDSCMVRARAKFEARTVKLALPECWDRDALFATSETEAKSAFSRIYCDENAPAPVCGDGLLAPWEDCDDGNTASGDCCAADCTFEAAGSTCPADGNVCTDEVCNATGTCLSQPNVAPCDDGQFCTTTDVCAGGVCGGSGDPCVGGDTCNDTCDEALDTCAETGTACEDGLFCTTNDTCQSGSCTGGGDPCTGGDACNATCNEELFHCFSAPGTLCAGGECNDTGMCLLEQGGTCSSNADCLVGDCIDGICCESACDGGCEACAFALTGVADGICAPVLAGTDPDDECRLPGGVDVCDGSGACTFCGDGVLEVGEQCDDGGNVSGDCCSSGCQLENDLPGCAPRATILTPVHGDFTQAQSVLVEGRVDNIQPSNVALTVGGQSVLLNADQSFSTQVTIVPDQIFQPIVARLTRLSDGEEFNDRIVLVQGAAIAVGENVGDGIGMRLTDTGLDSVEPAITSLVSIDPKELIPDGTVFLSNYCYQDTWFGCLGRIDVAIRHTSTLPRIDGFALDVDSQPAYVEGDITLTGLAVRAKVTNRTGVSVNCNIDITAQQTEIFGDYGLEPMPVLATKVDVSQQGSVAIATSGFSYSTSCSGILGGIIESLIGAFVGDMEALVRDGLQDFLNATDGSGNTPIAGAIETALDGIDLAGPIGEGLGLDLDTPFAGVLEDTLGITFPMNASILATTPDPEAPTFAGSLAVPTAEPTWPDTVPGTQDSYGIALGFSPSTFNQFLSESITSGLLRLTLSELDVGGTPVPINSTVLGAFLPAFNALPPLTPLEVRIAPTLSPVVTDTVGPDGEVATLYLAQLLIEIVQPTAGDAVRLAAAVDLELGLSLEAGEAGLDIQVGSPVTESINVVLLDNPLFVETVNVEALLPTMLELALPAFQGELGSFPLPSFFGLSLQPASDMVRYENYLTIFADLVSNGSPSAAFVDPEKDS